jgi:hypothetical protein
MKVRYRLPSGSLFRSCDRMAFACPAHRRVLRHHMAHARSHVDLDKKPLVLDDPAVAARKGKQHRLQARYRNAAFGPSR